MHRIERLTSDFHRELSDIIRALKDPRVSGFISVVRVQISNDLSFATAYISSLSGIEAAREAVAGLKNAEGFIKHELSGRLKMRKMPAIRFVADNSIEHGAHIAEVLKNDPPKPEEDS